MLAHRLLGGCSSRVSISCPSLVSALIAAAGAVLWTSFRQCSESPHLMHLKTMVSCLLGRSRLFLDSLPASCGAPAPFRLREHSLKGASEPQLAGRESGKKSGAVREARDHCFGVPKRGESEHCLNELQRQARAAAISPDPRDGHEKLSLLLLQLPGSLCASFPCQEPVQPATARVP